VFTHNQTTSNHAPDSHYGHFIDNQWVDGESGETIDSTNPATGAFLTKIPRGTAGNVDRAVQAAARAFKSWGKTSPAERANALLKIADLLEADAERFVAFESMDVGKPVREARVDVPLAIDHFRYFAGAIRSHSDEASMLDHQTMSLTLSEPLGVVGQVIPLELPAADGCLEDCPSDCYGQHGGDQAIRDDASHDFGTGKDLRQGASSRRGQRRHWPGNGSWPGDSRSSPGRQARLHRLDAYREVVAAAAAKRIIPATLELGGKSANIIFPDANWDRAVEAAALGILWNQGEVCESGSRLFVHESIYERFVDELKERFEKVRVGNPLAPNTQMGAQVSQIQTDRIMDYIELAKEEGARILTGGERLTGGEYDAGFFIKPTIIVDVRNDMRIAQEEIFGPVVTVLPFNDEDEVVALADASDYGLAGAVWTQDINRAIRVARAIETGRMWVNTYHDIPAHAPFGGYKKSGLGRETHKSMLDAYSEKKNIYISLNEAPFGVF